MPIPSSIADLSATAASNSPAGSDPPTEGDNHIRALAAIVRQVYDAQADTASASNGDALTGVRRTFSNAIATTQHNVNEKRTINLVSDCGGVADGDFTPGGSASGTDNLTAMNVALAAAEVLGYDVEVPGGGYYFSAGFTIPAGVKLRGHGTAWLPGFIAGTDRGTRLLINTAAAGSSITFAANAGHASLENLSVYHTNTNAITAVVNITGHLHPSMTSVEIASLRVTSGVGLLLDSATTGAQYGTIYGRFDNIVINITSVGTANEASVATGLKVYGRAIPPGPPNANAFFGGSIQGKNLALEMDGTGAGTGARNVAFYGVSFEGTYNTAQTHTYNSTGQKVVGFSTSACYTVQFVKLTRALGASFHGCYFELGGAPASYDDGINGSLSLASVVWLDSTAEVQFTEFLTCTWSAHVYDNGLRTVVNPTYSGHRYDTRKATNVLVRQAGAQTIANATYTKVTFGSVFEGDDAYLDWDGTNNWAVVKTQGVYLITWQVTMAGWATATTYLTSKCVAQGNDHQGTHAPQGGAGVPISSQGQVQVTLVVGDTIYIEAFHNQGGNQDTTGAAAQTRINISKIA